MTTSTPTPDDARLLDAWGRQGDRTALDELVRRHWPAAHATALAVLRDSTAAEDAAQEACVALARGARRFDGGRPFGPWFRALALNAARKHLRSAGRRARHEGHAPPASGEPTGAEERAQQAEVLEHLARLPDRVRAPVALKFLGGCTYDEVAVALGCPKETARSRIQAGLDRLRASLQAAGCAVPLDLAAWLAGVPRVEAPSPAAPTGATIALLAEEATRAARAVALALLAAVTLPAVLALTLTLARSAPRGDAAAVASGDAPALARAASGEPVAPTAPDLPAHEASGGASVPPAPPVVEARPITVRVRDAAGAPVPGAWVAPARGAERPEWGAPLVRADSGGVARLPPGAVRVWARAGIDEGAVEVGPDERDVVVVLSPPDPPPPGRGAIVLHVTESGDPVAEAPLVIATEFYESPRGRPLSLRGLVRTRTDERGRALLADLRPGIWSLTVRADGRAPTFEQLLVGVDGVEDVTVRVVGAVSLRGRVLVPPGIDATEVQLDLNDAGSPFEGRRVPVDAEGRWRADDVRPGGVRLRARAPGLAWRYDRPFVETTPAVQEAEPLSWPDDAGGLHGRLLGEDGAPLAGVAVVVVSTRREWVSTGPNSLEERPVQATLTTGADGRFVARGLPPEACVVAACAAAEHAPDVLLGEEAPGVIARVVVPAGGDVDLGDVRAAPGPGRLRGRVLGPDGRLVSGASVTVRCGNLPPVEVEAPDGLFAVDRLPAGPALVTLGPGTTTWAVVRPLEVALGDDRVVDVEVPVVPTSAVSGRVLLPPGFRGGVRVLLADVRNGPEGEQRPVDLVGGAWAVEGLAPGPWDVSVEGVTAPSRIDLLPGERRSLDLDLRELSVVAMRVDGLPADATSAEVTLEPSDDQGVSGARAHGRLRGGAATLLARPGRVRVTVEVWTTLFSDGSAGSPVALERNDGWRLEREGTLADVAASLVVRWPAPAGVVRGTTSSYASIEADDGAGLTAWVMASERFELALPAGRWRVRVVDEPVPGAAGGPAVEVVVAPGATIDLPAPLLGPR